MPSYKYNKIFKLKANSLFELCKKLKQIEQFAQIEVIDKYKIGNQCFASYRLTW